MSEEKGKQDKLKTVKDKSKKPHCADCGRPLDGIVEQGYKYYCGACGSMHGW